jgi:hypothetical protein
MEEPNEQQESAPDYGSSNMATYSPEDNKLRLYIGRVPREEYLKLRAEGWKALHKQREAGGGDFVATWTPSRRDTALEYAGVILDEDMGPAERAADRAERFAGYREKRLGEATGHADTYDAGPTAHGFQSAAKAERSARRHDRLAARSVDSWDKAEYWQQRTAGVIAHALYKSSPSVRMGRIKTIEADLRSAQKSMTKWRDEWLTWKACAEITDAEKQTERATMLANYAHFPRTFNHPRSGKEDSLWSLLASERNQGDPITGAEACALFFERYPNEPKTENAWTRHFKLRIAYENQMLEGQGGRAALVEMEVGGWFGSYQIRRVIKSPVTKLPVSVEVMANTHTYKLGQRVPITEPILYNIERTGADEYRPPTEDDKKAMAAILAAEKKTRKETAPPTIPLINPTDDDAQRLQDLWNEAKRLELEDYKKRNHYGPDFKASEVCRITQAKYSANSSGVMSRCETRELCQGGEKKARHYTAKTQPPVVAKVRATWGEQNTAWRVIIITDKPQKPLPAAVWQPLKAAPAPKAEADPIAEYWKGSASESVLKSYANAETRELNL